MLLIDLDRVAGKFEVEPTIHNIKPRLAKIVRHSWQTLQHEASE